MIEESLGDFSLFLHAITATGDAIPISVLTDNAFLLYSFHLSGRNLPCFSLIACQSGLLEMLLTLERPLGQELTTPGLPSALPQLHRKFWKEQLFGEDDFRIYKSNISQVTLHFGCVLVLNFLGFFSALLVFLMLSIQTQ